MTQPTLFSIPAGEWLQAAANIIGVAGTILGTLWIEHKWRARGDRSRLRKLLHRLVTFEKYLDRYVPSELTEDEDRVRSMAAQDVVLKLLAQFRFTRSRSDVVDPDQWLALEEVENAISSYEPMLAREVGILSDAGNNTAVYDVNRSKISEAYAEIARCAQLAIDALKK